MKENSIKQVISNLEQGKPLDEDQKRLAIEALHNFDGEPSTQDDTNSWQLHERIKELNCLYSILNLMISSENEFSEVIQEVADLIPSGFTEPENTTAQIFINENLYTSTAFSESDYVISNQLIGADGQEIGSLKVAYLNSDNLSHQFLKEEHELVENIAGLISKFYDHKVVKNQLVDSERLFRTTLYSIGDAVIMTDKEGVIQRMNEVAENLTGWKENEAASLPLEEVFRIINMYSRLKVKSPVEKVLQKGGVVGLANHTLLISKDGAEIPISDSGAPIKDENGLITGVVLVFRDQTEEFKAEEALRQSEEKYRLIFENSPLGIFNFDEKGNITECNDKFVEIIGSTREKILELNLFDIPDEKLYSAVGNALNGLHSFYAGDYHSITANKVTPVRASFAPFTNKHGAIKGGVCIVEDNTVNKRAKDALERSEQRSSSLFEHHPDGILSLDLDGRIIDLNPQAVEVTGYSKNELIGNIAAKFLDSDEWDRVTALFEEVTDGKPKQYDTIGITKEGERRNLNITQIPIIVENKITGIYVIIKDRTEQRETEELLHKTYRLARIGRWERDLINEKEIWSGVTKEIYEVDPEYDPSMENVSVFIKDGKDKENLKHAIEKAMKTGEPFDLEAELVTAKRNKRWVRILGEAEFINSKCRRLFGTIQDIHERKQAEIESLRSQMILESVADQAEAVIFVKDEHGRYILVNKEFRRYFGLGDQEIVGKTEFDVLEKSVAKKFRENDYKVLETNKALTQEEKVKTRYGDRYFLTSIFPIRGITGLDNAVGGFSTDITELKKAEQQALKQREAISYLSSDKELVALDKQTRLREIARTSAETLGVDEVNIWNLENGILRCVASYADGSYDHMVGHEIEIKNYPNYYEELRNNRIIISDYAQDDEKMKGLDKDYLKKRNIQAVLDNCVFRSGSVVGMVGHNMIGKPREWKHDEINFVESISDQVAQVLADEERKENEDQIRKSLREKEILLVEIHHRVKNNLAVISSMLQLQAYKTEDEELKNRLLDGVGRIKAMANIHEHLYQSDSFTDLDFAENLKKLIATIVNATPTDVKIDLEFDCEPTPLSVIQAVPSSLIVNEVITNILKHAFKEKSRGTISTKLYQDKDTVYLQISDNGSGLPENFRNKESSSLGLRIIDVLSRQLEAENEYRKSKQGSIFILKFKKKNTEELKVSEKLNKKNEGL